jgi:uncharacterized protein (TIGR02453 family)
MYNIKSAFQFLALLSKHNNREWFNEHKDQYLAAHSEIVHFAEELFSGLTQVDEIETISGKKALHRIYRDTRFSKDKTPYKIHFSGGFRRATAWRRGGYYFHLQPGNSFIAGGFWGPNKEDLAHIRSHLAIDHERFREVIDEQSFKSRFGSLKGQQLKTAPKGWDKEHEAIDLLRFKSFVFKQPFADSEVFEPGFHEKMLEGFNALRPFFDFMSEVLTTDLNGESIVENSI